jgi:UDP-galactopyranose mutase
MSCLRSPGHCDLRHGCLLCMCFSVFVLSRVYVEALQRADPPSKESYRFWIDQETEKRTGPTRAVQIFTLSNQTTKSMEQSTLQKITNHPFDKFLLSFGTQIFIIIFTKVKHWNLQQVKLIQTTRYFSKIFINIPPNLFTSWLTQIL